MTWLSPRELLEQVATLLAADEVDDAAALVAGSPFDLRVAIPAEAPPLFAKYIDERDWSRAGAVAALLIGRLPERSPREPS